MKMIVCAAALALVLVGPASAAFLPTPGDPGFPFVDVNGDGLFQGPDGDIGKGTGVDILALILNDGSFDTALAEGGYKPPASPASLVVPKSVSVSSKTLAGLELQAGLDLAFSGQASLPRGDQGIDLTAGRHLRADGARLSSPGSVYLEAGAAGTGDASDPGSLSAAGAAFSSRAEGVTLVSAQEVLADGLAASAGGTYGDVSIENRGPSRISLRNAKLASKLGAVTVDCGYSVEDDGPGGDLSDGFLVDVTGATLAGHTEAIIETHGQRVKGAGLKMSAKWSAKQGVEGEVLVDSAGGMIDIPGAQLTGASSITLWTWVEDEDARRESLINVAGGRLQTAGDPGAAIDLDAGGCGGGDGLGGVSRILADGAAIQSAFAADISGGSSEGPGFIDVHGSTLRIAQNKGATEPGDLDVMVSDDDLGPKPSVIDATGAVVADPQLPTFFAETVIGDPTPKKPDLHFAGYPGLSAKGLALDGDLQVDWTIANQGPADTAGPATLKLVFSADGILDAADPTLGTESSPGPLPAYNGTTWTGSKVYRVPGGFPANTPRWVFAILDPANAADELNESDNQAGAGFQIKVLPDLVPTAISAVRAGTGRYDVTDSIKNAGRAGAAGFYVRYFLTAGPSSPRYQIGWRRIDGLASGASGTATTACNAALFNSPLPPAGAYRVLVEADRGTPEEVPEMDETNNALLSTGTVAFP